MTSASTYSNIGIYRPSIQKDPDAVLDYSFDWTDWLAGVSDSIDSYSITGTDVAVLSDSRNGAIITVWCGAATPGTVAKLVCRVVTAGARIEDRTIYLIVKER